MQGIYSLLHRHFGQHRILGGAAVLALTQFAASLAGLIRDNTLASVFGDRGEVSVVDAYIASFRPSDFLLQTFILSAVGTVMVPMIAQYCERGDREEMQRLLAGAVGFGGLVFGVMAIVLAIVFPWISHFFVDFQGDHLALYERFVRLTLLTDLLFVFGNIYGQYLITIQRYWIYGITPVLYTLGTILGTLIFTPYIGAYGPMMGTVAGTVIFVVLRVWATLRSGVGIQFRFWHPDIGSMGLLMIPRMLALGAVQLQLLFFDKFASGLDAGSVMLNAYARNFQSVIVGVAGIAVAQSAFSLLSQAAARSERKRFIIYLSKGTLLLLVITIPGAIMLGLLAPLASRLVHVTEYLPTFRVILWAYVISIPFESVNHLLLRAYYATKHTLVPALGMVLSVIVAVATAQYLLTVVGARSFGIGYSAGAVVMTLFLVVLLPTRLRTLTPVAGTEEDPTLV